MATRWQQEQQSEMDSPLLLLLLVVGARHRMPPTLLNRCAFRRATGALLRSRCASRLSAAVESASVCRKYCEMHHAPVCLLDCLFRLASPT